MGLFDKLLSKAAPAAIAVETKPDTVYLPIAGEVIPLPEIGDGVFSEEVLGKGCGIRPAEELVYAPVTGEVTILPETKHAVGLMSEDGVEVLVHVGLDTVDMNGTGFEPLVKEGQKVSCGQPILKFSMEKIRAAGHPLTTALVVTNSDDCQAVELLKTGDTEHLSPVLKITK